MKEVLQIMRDHQLYAKQSKYSFGQPQMEYLGHIISGEGVSTDPEKIRAMVTWPIPDNIKQLRLSGAHRVLQKVH